MSQTKPERLVALDALRGFTIAAMIIVNSPGSEDHIYRPLHHASWHGLTLTDLVYPFFLFIVGVSITLAYSKQLEARAAHTDLIRKIVLRGVKIFALGVFLNLWPGFDFGEIRIAGVLQRIAIVFLVCALIFLKTTWKRQLWLGTGMLVLYGLLMGWVPVPIDSVIQSALDTGTVERGHGTSEHVDNLRQLSEGFIAANYQPGTNLAAWVDRLLLPGQMYEVTWDPEGLLSTLAAIVSGIIGMLVGRLVLSITDTYRRLTWLFFCGFCLFLAGGIWGWVFPLNKNLWTSSYVLWTGGIATMGLAACILIIDTLGYNRWTRLGIVYGANSLTSYVLAGMLTIVFYQSLFGMTPWNQWFLETLGNLGVAAKLASFLYAFLYMLVIYIPVLILYKKKIFIRL